jgi:hypothetical protein
MSTVTTPSEDVPTRHSRGGRAAEIAEASSLARPNNTTTHEERP